MKKLIAAIALASVGAASAFAQGTISVYNISATFATHTNSAFYSSSLNGVANTTQGLTTTTANGWYYALLVQSSVNTVTTVNPLDSGWSVGMMATNYLLAGGIRGNGGSAGAAVTGWAAPTGATYSSAATQDYYVLVGWSASLGSTWSEVAAQLESGSWVADGFFGVSALGEGYAGGGPNSLTAPNIFGTGVNAGGLTSGLTEYFVTPVPEPTTMALAAIGGASLLLFRRKKQA